MRPNLLLLAVGIVLLPGAATWAQAGLRVEPSATTAGRYSSNLTLTDEPSSGVLLTATPAVGLRYRRSTLELFLLYSPQATLPTAFATARRFGMQHDIRGTFDNRYTPRTALSVSGGYKQSLFGDSPDALGLAPNSSLSGTGTLTYELAERFGLQATARWSRSTYTTEPYNGLSQTTLMASETFNLRLLLKASAFLQLEQLRILYPTRPTAQSLHGFLGFDSQITSKLAVRARAGAGHRSQGGGGRVVPIGDVMVREDFTPMTRVTLTVARRVEDARLPALYALDDSVALEGAWQIFRPLALVPNVKAHLFGYEGERTRDFIYRAGLSVRLNASRDVLIDLNGGLSRRTSSDPRRTYQEHNFGLSLSWYPSMHP